LSRAGLRSRIAPFALLSILICILTCNSACTTPLAPAYRISKESREIQFVSGAPPELKIRARFTLINYGSADLKFIDMVVPVEKTSGFRNLHVEVDGREVAPAPLPAELQYDHPHTLRLPLESTWGRKQKRELSIEYALRSPEDPGSQVAIEEKTFSLGFRGWFTVLQPPDHALSPFPDRPDKTLITIRVPSKFLVLSRGTKSGVKKAGDETEHRYLLRTKDLAPFVVAGQYLEASGGHSADSLVFWTVEQLKGDSTASAQRIAAAWNTLQTDFGPLDKNKSAPHVVESPELRDPLALDPTASKPGPAAAPFPGGALVNSEALALGIDSDEFLDKVTRALARNWFGEQIYPAPFAQVGLGQGLPAYATIVIDKSRKGEPARRERVVKLLREYDAASKSAVEIPLGVAKMTDPPEQRAISLAKAPLFFIALEDRYGEAPVRTALTRVVSLLRGQQVGYNDIRSAIEQSSGKDLAEFFRIWLYEKGIPGDFRTKYEPANESKP
jgi:hypothetical protein